MKTLLFLSALISVQFTHAQQSGSINKQLKKLERFMAERIPINHSGVNGYKLTLDGCILTKETLLDRDSHSKSFDLHKAHITYNHDQVDDESAEVYGYKDYWDVDINGDWLHTEILKEKDAQNIVYLLTNLQKGCE